MQSDNIILLPDLIVLDIVAIPISPSIYDFRAFEVFLEHLEGGYMA